MSVLDKIYKLNGMRFMDLYEEANLVLTKYSRVFYVDSVTGSDSYSGRSIKSPLATLAKAYSLCTDDYYDVVVVLPTHAETVTAVLTIAKTGVQIVGMKAGNKRPIITGNGTIDIISIEEANCTVGAIKFAGPLTDAQTADINIAGAYARVFDTQHIGSVSTENKVNVITVTADGDDCLIEGVRIYNTVVEVPGAILLEGAATNVEIRDTHVYDAIGFTNGAIYDAAAATGVLLEDCLFMNAKAATAVVNFANNSVGMGRNIGVNGRHTTIASNIVSGTAFNFFQAYVCEEVSKSGMVWNIDAD